MNGRNYGTCDYPSVTEIVGCTSDLIENLEGGLYGWYGHFGNAHCKKILEESQEYGHYIHALLGSSLKGLSLYIDPNQDNWAFEQMQNWVDKQGFKKLHLIEPSPGLISEKYEFCGTPDLIADDKVIDWKTDSAPRTVRQEKERQFKYALQLVGYSLLFEENYKQWINTGVIIRANKKHQYAEYTFTQLRKWKKHFLALREIYFYYRGR